MKMGLFKSQAEKERLSHVKTLLALALADDNMSKDEIAAIATVGAREDVDVEEIEKMLNGTDNVQFTIPESDDQKIQQLRDMVVLMLIDGKSDENELDLCRAVADRFGFREEIVEALAKQILEEINNE